MNGDMKHVTCSTCAYSKRDGGQFYKCAKGHPPFHQVHWFDNCGAHVAKHKFQAGDIVRDEFDRRWLILDRLAGISGAGYAVTRPPSIQDTHTAQDDDLTFVQRVWSPGS